MTSFFTELLKFESVDWLKLMLYLSLGRGGVLSKKKKKKKAWVCGPIDSLFQNPSPLKDSVFLFFSDPF